MEDNPVILCGSIDFKNTFLSHHVSYSCYRVPNLQNTNEATFGWAHVFEFCSWWSSFVSKFFKQLQTAVKWVDVRQ